MGDRHGRRARHRRHKARFRLHSMRLRGRLYTGDHLGTMMARQCIAEEVALSACRSPRDVMVAMPREFGTERSDLLQLSEMVQDIEAVREQLRDEILAMPVGSIR